MSLRCAVCREGVTKYKCPRCLIQTCCLACVKQHKAETGCSGVRDKTAYVNMTSFTDMHLLSDYRFLEDAARKADCANRDALKRRSERPWHVNKLIHQARLRGVQLRVLPYPSTKRKQNKTYFNNKTKAFSWHIEWVFPELNFSHAEKIAEETILESAMLNLLQSTQVNEVLKHRMSVYMEENSLQFLMRVEGRRADSPRYHALDPKNSLKGNLAGKVIVEYPTILVIDRDSCDASYSVLGSDGATVEGLPKVVSCEPDSSCAESDNDDISPEGSAKSIGLSGTCTKSTRTVLPTTSDGAHLRSRSHEAGLSEDT